MKIPTLARYNGTVEKAYKFVFENITSFPINPFDLIKKFKWNLITYEDLAQKNSCSINDICECFGADGYSVYNGKNYCIAYNSKIKNLYRIYFTLMHEIGHIVLGHHKDFEVTGFLQDNFTQSEYKILENEANCFARNVLAPVPLVQCLNTFDYYFRLSTFFNLSFKASNTRRSFYKNDLYYLNDNKAREMQLKYKRYNKCKKCFTYPLSIDDFYCPICGNNNFILGDVFTMKEYKGISIEELQECPRCENIDVESSHNYCKICGLSLINKCISCQSELTSNARYCTACGSISSYFQAGLLKDWKTATDINSDFVFSQTPSDDLPF